MVRLWVISPTGTYDYCDVLLIVQTNMGGCGDISSAVRGSITTELDDNIEQVEVTATLQNGQSTERSNRCSWCIPGSNERNSVRK